MLFRISLAIALTFLCGCSNAESDAPLPVSSTKMITLTYDDGPLGSGPR